MSGKSVAIIEGIIGLILLIAGAADYWWSRQLVWIMTYPPPIQKQVIDILPYIVSIIGMILIIDSFRRYIGSKR